MLKRALLGFVLAVALPTSAHAHSALVGGTPEAGSVLANFPSRIALTFNEPLLKLNQGKANTLRITSPQGEEVALATPVIEGSTISTTATSTPEEIGEYTLSYRVVSNDGHPIEGSFTFSISADGESATPHTTTTENQNDVLKENGETGKALLVFIALAALALMAYRTFIGRK